ncbi:unnamed protein product [Caenorhabditis sp. 36 PRJEB53466]|nr:unnamed protein product [Caenorhabditis sp. 36 PRJEB53466]
MFTYYWVIFFLNILNFLSSFLLLRKNSQLKRFTLTLTSKYQLEEVYLSTKFAVSVVSVHVFLFGAYVAVIMLARSFGDLVIVDVILLKAVRGAITTMIGTYNFAIGIAAVYLYKRTKSRTSESVNGAIEMKATGNAGAKNYDDAIFSIWNSTGVADGRRITQSSVNFM